MAMELYLLFAMQDAPNLENWRGALSERDLPLSITEEVDLTTHSGFLPMRLEEQEAGLYFLIDDYADLVAHIPRLQENSIEDPVVYALGSGGRHDEGAAVFYSVHALTVTFNGLAFDPQSGAFVDAEALLQAARLFHDMAASR